MKPIATLFAAALLATTLHADVPTSINYQGVVQVAGADFTGTGQFKFALVLDPPLGSDITLWSHDGTSIKGSAPSSAIALQVSSGLFTVALGQTGKGNATEPIDPADVDREGVLLRVWFSDGVNGFAMLAPDRPLHSVPYALQAETVAGTISGDQITPNSIGSAQIANDLTLLDLDLGSLSSDGDLRLLGRHTGGGIVNPGEENERVKVYADAPSAFLGQPTFGGGIDLFDQSETLRLSARAHQASLSLNESNGAEGVFLRGDTTAGGGLVNVLGTNASPGVQLLGQQSGTSGGVLSVHDSMGDERVEALGLNGTLRLLNEGATISTLRMTGDEGELVALKSVGIAGSVGAALLQASLAKTATGGVIRTRRSDNLNSTMLSNDTSGGGLLSLYDASGDITAELEAASSVTQGGRLQLREADNSLSVRLGAEGTGGGGFLTLNNGGGAEAIVLDAVAADGSAVMRMRDSSGDVTAELRASDNTQGGRLQLSERDGSLAVKAGSGGTGGGGFITLHDKNGNTVIELDADENGEAVTRTQVLEITGGSDLSEKFDIAPAPGQNDTPPAPGAIVCIDPDHPGALITSSAAYDRRVAGVISGAGGVKPGMLMGQRGSIADGSYPVALTGRVFCQVDASFGAIEPGDLITTSDTPGHGMRVDDHSQAPGAVIGKAMTRLDSGRGLVLVLVSLQ